MKYAFSNNPEMSEVDMYKYFTEGLGPMMMVLGAIPKPARTSPSSTQLKRSKAINADFLEVGEEKARGRLVFGLARKYNRKEMETMKIFHELRDGSPVLVYQTILNSWEGS